jgi:hypothetical protein
VTEEEMTREFDSFPHADLVRAVVQMKVELATLYDAVNRMSQMQETHSQVLAIFVAAFEQVEQESDEKVEQPPRPGMYL